MRWINWSPKLNSQDGTRTLIILIEIIRSRKLFIQATHQAHTLRFDSIVRRKNKKQYDFEPAFVAHSDRIEANRPKEKQIYQSQNGDIR